VRATGCAIPVVDRSRGMETYSLYRVPRASRTWITPERRDQILVVVARGQRREDRVVAVAVQWVERIAAFARKSQAQRRDATMVAAIRTPTSQHWGHTDDASLDDRCY
jgi:hypothetical protein